MLGKEVLLWLGCDNVGGKFPDPRRRDLDCELLASDMADEMDLEEPRDLLEDPSNPAAIVSVGIKGELSRLKYVIIYKKEPNRKQQSLQLLLGICFVYRILIQNVAFSANEKVLYI